MNLRAELVARTLATYKQLRDVVVVDAVPRLPSGKGVFGAPCATSGWRTRGSPRGLNPVRRPAGSGPLSPQGV